MNDKSRSINDEYNERVLGANLSEETQQMRVTEQASDQLAENQRLVIPLAEEYLDVNKQWVQSGEVRLRKSVETSTQSVPVEIEYEEVQIDRVPVNRTLAYGEKTEPWWDGDVMVVPVIEEEIVVTKRQVLREEVRITKRRVARQETASDTVRSERISVETVGSLEPVSGNNEEASRGSVER